jgi:transcriptional regulator with XRE-family HTH domain
MASPAQLAQPVLRRFSRRVRAARVKAGWSQRELGQRSYMTEDFVRRIERGTENPSLATIALLALALNCDVRELLTPE